MYNDGKEVNILCYISRTDQWYLLAGVRGVHRIYFLSDLIIDSETGEILKCRESGIIGEHYLTRFTEVEMTAIMMQASTDVSRFTSR